MKIIIIKSFYLCIKAFDSDTFREKACNTDSVEICESIALYILHFNFNNLPSVCIEVINFLSNGIEMSNSCKKVEEKSFRII